MVSAVWCGSTAASNDAAPRARTRRTIEKRVARLSIQLDEASGQFLSYDTRVLKPFELP